MALLPLPPLNPLKAFEAVGRLHGVARAAEELCVTPAAVARQVKVLEEFLQVPLFHRGQGGMTPTPAGQRYLDLVGPLLGGLREATNVAMGGSYRRHVLRMRSPATFAVKWLIPRLASFHAAHPDIDVQLTTSPAPLDFDREDIEAGVELGSGDWPRVHALRLVDNLLLPVMSPRAGFARPAVPADCAARTLLHSMARPDDWALWLAAAGVARCNPYQGMKYETSLLAYQAAAEGHGIALAQKAFVERELADGTLAPASDFVLDRGAHTYYFAWPAERAESRALASFRAWLAQAPR